MTPMDIFWLVATFLLGAVFGSFLNVCIHRMPLGISLIWPPSHCPKCFQPVGRYNVPIVGYFILRGRCHECGEPFSVRYALIELATALMCACFYYVFVVTHATPPVVYGAYVLFTMMLIVATFVDLSWKIIPQQLERDH